MSYSEYGNFLKSNKLSTDAQAMAMVKRIGTRVQGAVERYFKEKGIEVASIGEEEVAGIPREKLSKQKFRLL